MSEETKISERTAIRDGFEEQIRHMFGVFVDNIARDDADITDACVKFKKGLGYLRKAIDLANQMISE